MKTETKGKLKGAVAGFLAAALLVGGGVFAAQRSEMIEVFYDDIEIYVDGQKVDPKDANGQTVQPFIYNGTTYLPVRAVGNAIGKDVAWDGVEKVVYLGTKPGDADNWLNVCAPYQVTNWEKYTLADNQYFVMSGNKYSNGFVSRTKGSSEDRKSQALFNLNGRFNNFEFLIGHIDGTEAQSITIDIYLDGLIAYTGTVNSDDLVKKISIPLNGALQMKIEIKGGKIQNFVHYTAEYGISEVKFS